MTDVAALETTGLGRRYRSRWGLRDCSLTVSEGSITGLVGPNGAGKSTLLRLAAGLSRPTAGTVSIFGEPVEPNSTRHLRRMGYFDQLRPLYSGLRVDETLHFGERFNQRWDNDAALQLLNELEVPLTERIGRLSLGQQALVALALCIGKLPDLLLLDEPVASLDPLGPPSTPGNPARNGGRAGHHGLLVFAHHQRARARVRPPHHPVVFDRPHHWLDRGVAGGSPCPGRTPWPTTAVRRRDDLDS